MPVTRDHPGLAGRESAPLDAATLAEADAVVITTDHTAVDYGLVGTLAKLILDTRNVFGEGTPAVPYVKI